ncbi:class I SAM-dependent methyltransferase [Thalassotalea sp. ND16A]|uniref:class I SAM-dependent methyltransferase n=1 Tax=Thalassotalea sp. ND16A TaxID=1535422 RepID=UPI00051D3A2B|nr:class I SAM-dependent methyltransferase [Thalassotalea sp. ND16A]KGJ90472.1 hypothetical protein ND16A_1868 [Thalassotalea sp. ND16A]
MSKSNENNLQDLGNNYQVDNTSGFDALLAGVKLSSLSNPRVLVINPPIDYLNGQLKELSKICNILLVHKEQVNLNDDVVHSFHFYKDSLPSLDIITNLEISFDFIFICNVDHLVTVNQIPRTFRKTSNLLKPNGKIVFLSNNALYQDHVENQATLKGLITLKKETIRLSNLKTFSIELKLPDDGTGAFPFIRHVALNDGKAATHKLALLRVLLRIADGHPGAVLKRENGRVIIPAGLVALYWCHQYKDMIDKYNIFQTPNLKPNMGFMKADGWHKLVHRTSADYRIGNLFTGKDAIALYKTLSHSVQNIKEMPCRYITYSNSKDPVFNIEKQTVKAKETLFLDLQSLSQWGEFSLPESIWLAFNRYACWIEPVLISEWSHTMSIYKGNHHFIENGEQHILNSALVWLDPVRTTTGVRKRMQELQQSEQQHCVWSNKKLDVKFDIDHCMPFARWPNNDLWNLLPTNSKVNSEKRDQLPSEKRLRNSKNRIKDWWQEAWLENTAINKQLFFSEANIALPGLSSDNQSKDDLFEALLLQQSRLKEMQQLREW